MPSSVTLNCQVTMIGVNSGSQLSEISHRFTSHVMCLSWLLYLSLSQRSQVSRIALWRSSLNVVVIVVFFVFVYVLFLVSSCLLITLITCLTGRMSLKVLYCSVFQQCVVVSCPSLLRVTATYKSARQNIVLHFMKVFAVEEFALTFDESCHWGRLAQELHFAWSWQTQHELRMV